MELATRLTVLGNEKQDAIHFKRLKSEDVETMEKTTQDDTLPTLVDQKELTLLNNEKPLIASVKNDLRQLKTTAVVNQEELMLLNDEKPAVTQVSDIREVGAVADVVDKKEIMLLLDEDWKPPTMLINNPQPTGNPGTRLFDNSNEKKPVVQKPQHPDSQEYTVAPTIDMGDIQDDFISITDLVHKDQVEHEVEMTSQARTPSKSPKPQTFIQNRTRELLHRQVGRVVMDAVEVPTLASIRRIPRSQEVVKSEPTEIWEIPIKPEPLTEDDIVKLEFLQGNPDVKIKQEATLSDEGVAHRLNALGPGALDIFPIDLPHHVKKATVTRAWMADTFGGNRQKTCPEINKEKFPHGMDDFWYMTYDFNPNAPRIPGGPGLMFGIVDEDDDKGMSFGPQRLIMRTRSPRWTYMGQYRSTPSSPLTQEEWSAESAKFRNYWAKEISIKPWGSEIRIRIGLRHDLGRKPTEEEKYEAASNGAYKFLSQDLIKQAFASGEEKIAVWCMRCIGYDKPFQRKLETMPENYVSPNDKKSKGPKTEKGGRKGKQSAKAKQIVNTKRKRQSVEVNVTFDEENDQFSDKELSEQEDDDDDVDGPSVLQGRRKSRRIIKAPIRPDAIYDDPAPSPKRRRYVSSDAGAAKGKETKVAREEHH